MVFSWTSYADDSAAAKSKLWDPLEVLGINNTDPGYGGITCIGYAPSQRRRCRNPIRADNREFITRTLNELAYLDPRSPAVASKLKAIVGPALCVRYHQNQDSEVLQRWKQELQRVRPRSKFEAKGPTTTKNTPAQRDFAMDDEGKDLMRELQRKLVEIEEKLKEMQKIDKLRKERDRDAKTRREQEEKVRQRKKTEEEERQRLDNEEETEGEESEEEDENDDLDDDDLDDDDLDDDDLDDDDDDDDEERQRKEREEEQERQRQERQQEAERQRKSHEQEERLKKERLEKERLEEERHEKERLEKERLEKERLESAAHKERIRQRAQKVRDDREREKREKAAREQAEWATAWKTYQTQWTAFRASSQSSSSTPIPWPVKSGCYADVRSSTVEEFLQRAVPADANWSRVMRAECLKWHPDKRQILFKGREPTLAESIVVEVVCRIVTEGLNKART